MVLSVFACTYIQYMCLWPCAGHVLLAMCWSCAGCVLVMCWSCAGHVLVMCCWLTQDWRLRCSTQTGQRQVALKSPHRSTRSACEGRRGGERGRGGGRRRGKGVMYTYMCIEKRKAMHIQYMYSTCCIHIVYMLYSICTHARLLPCALVKLSVHPSLSLSLSSLSPLTISRMLRAHFWCEMQKGAEHVSRSSFPVRWKWICSRIFSCRREGEERGQPGGRRDMKSAGRRDSYNLAFTHNVHV